MKMWENEYTFTVGDNVSWYNFLENSLAKYIRSFSGFYILLSGNSILDLFFSLRERSKQQSESICSLHEQAQLFKICIRVSSFALSVLLLN